MLLVSILRPYQVPQAGDMSSGEPHTGIYFGGNTIYAQTSVSTPKIGVLGVHYDLISQYNWDVRVAYAIMMAESRGNPNIINWRDKHRTCGGSFGLFQLACFRGSKETLLDPETNVKMAYEIWKREGWRPWGAYTNKSYLKFL